MNERGDKPRQSRKAAPALWLLLLATGLSAISLASCDDPSGTVKPEIVEVDAEDLDEAVELDETELVEDVELHDDKEDGKQIEVEELVELSELDEADEETIEELPPECEPEERRCAGLAALELCIDGRLETQDCEAGELCRPSTSSCEPPLCPQVGEAYACEGENAERVCDEGQFAYTIRSCASGLLCFDGRCQALSCPPNSRRCRGLSEVEECNAQGTGWQVVQSCTTPDLCLTDRCVDACTAIASQPSSIGCTFYVLDMDNETNTDPLAFGVLVGNPGSSTANVELRWSENGQPKSISRQLSSGQSTTITVSASLDVNDSGLYADKSLVLTSNVPVTAAQINAMPGSQVYSTDASLLLPVHVLGTRYMVLGYPVSTSYEAPAYVDVVATENNTTVTLTSPRPVPASAGFPGLVPGSPLTMTLAKGELLHVLSGNTMGEDLSALTIDSSEPVAVFYGSRCPQIPSGTAYCDHVESQLLPIENWGREYNASKFAQRGTEVDVWRVIAAEDNTTISFSPAQAGVLSTVLARGEVREFQSDSNFRVSASKPIALAQFMVGSEHPGVASVFQVPHLLDTTVPCESFICLLLGGTCTADGCAQNCGEACTNSGGTCSPSNICVTGTGIGDPAMTLAIPVEQYKSAWVVVVPSGFAENYLTVIAGKGRVPLLDGVRLDAAPWSVAPKSIGTLADVFTVSVESGTHSIIDSAGIAVQVQGFDQNVSYAFPGGLWMEPL